ncbi:MAG: tyrosine-type recombinase/integrase [bacterium]
MGTVEKRGNSWRVGVQVYDENGKRKWIRRTFKLNAALSESQQRRQAEKALKQLEVDVENGKARPESSMTLRALAELWVKRHVAVNCAPVTQADYQHLLDCRILPKLGDTPVEKLTPGMLTDFLAEIKAEGRMVHRKADGDLARKRTPSDAKKMTTDPTKPLSGRTLVAYYDLLDNMLRHAVQWEILWRNPMDNVERPRFRSKPVKYLDDEQAVALLRELQTVKSLSYRCAVLLALLDETRQQHQECAELLGDRWRGDGRIVCNWDGSPMHHDTPSKWFRKYAKAHGFDVTFHQLRHTHATLLFASNIDAVAVASHLGHTKADTTLRIYAHAIKSRDQASANAMQNLLDRANAAQDEEPVN